jgi:hypothetical protein
VTIDSLLAGEASIRTRKPDSRSNSSSAPPARQALKVVITTAPAVMNRR